ncbi:MAG: hypothetical protein LAN70_16260 [Acidobacteriia bacterium]|nr:hypothetical protein [Terriglobia bacterium]
MAVVLTALSASGQDSACSEINAAKAKTYGFHPTQVDQKTREAKSKAMDSFWLLVKSKGRGGQECLKQLLTTETKDQFFLFDGASLLLSLDGSEASLTTVTDAVQRTDMAEVDFAGYMRLTLQLASRGADTGPLVLRYLRQENPVANAPAHAMSFDRNMAAILLFGSMRPEMVDRYAIPALTDPDTNVRAAVAIAVAINMTENSFKALQAFQLGQIPEQVRKQLVLYRTYTPLKFAGERPTFSREQVLKVIRRVPHTEEEFEAVSTQYSKILEEREKSEPKMDPHDTKALAASVNRHVEEDEPYFGIAGAKKFLQSAVLTLGEQDLPELREARRKSVHGLSDETMYEYFAYTQVIEGIINRLDLYKNYRLH